MTHEQRDDFTMNFLTDFYEDDFAEGYDQSAKDQATVPKPLAADIQDQQTSFVYNSIKNIMVSSFCHGFSLQE